jgi:uncharacterized protein (DUF2249 family)
MSRAQVLHTARKALMTATLTPTTLELDLRTMAPRERHPLIFGHFDALAIGGSLQLVNDHNPQPLYYQFDDCADGQFTWSVLEAGPAVWRIEITRIAAATATSARAKGGSCCSGGTCCG